MAAPLPVRKRHAMPPLYLLLIPVYDLSIKIQDVLYDLCVPAVPALRQCNHDSLYDGVQRGLDVSPAFLVA